MQPVGEIDQDLVFIKHFAFGIFLSCTLVFSKPALADGLECALTMREYW